MRTFLFFKVAFLLCPSLLYALPSVSSDSRLQGATSVAVGDLNGDGFDDLIVGGDTSVRVYRGLPKGGYASSAAVRDTGNAFTSSLLFVGDINGDGRGDVLMQHYVSNEVLIVSGPGVSVYYGHATEFLPLQPAVKIEDFSQILSSVSYKALGDVNGDGFQDVLLEISEGPGSLNPFYDKRMYLGSDSFNGASYVSIDNTFFPSGVSLSASLVDVWGVGRFKSLDHDDMLLRSYETSFDTCDIGFYSTGYIEKETWFLYDRKNNTKQTVLENQMCVYFSEGIPTNSHAPVVLDAEGDGVKDIFLNSQLYKFDGERLTLTGNLGNAASGLYSAFSSGDLNGDGYEDMMFQTSDFLFNRNSQSWEKTDKTFTAYGSSLGLSSGKIKLNASQTHELFMQSAKIVNMGDLNVDGYPDTLIGTDVYFGGSSGVSSVGVDSVQSTANSFGFFAAQVGDVNGDGYGDVVVSAPLYTNGETNEGALFVYHGSKSGLLSTPVVSESNISEARMGHSVSSAGDVNGDGFGDIVVGLPYVMRDGVEEGQVWVLYGSRTGVSLTDKTVLTPHINSKHFGSSVSFASDVNGDGFQDVVVGAVEHGTQSQGAAFVFVGSPAGASKWPLWWIEGTADNERCGASVSFAGDVNGDGYSDIVVGSPGAGSSSQGKARVFHGSAQGVSFTPAWEVTGTENNQGYGSSVSSAGDVNGDGYSDLIVGSPGFGTTSVRNKGKVFVYHGTRTGLSLSARWNTEGTAADQKVGSYVSYAKDLDGDGYGDIVVGALGLLGKGGFVQYGSASGLVTSSVQYLENPSSTAELKVFFAGDVNGDGCHDVITLREANKRVRIFFGNGRDIQNLLPVSKSTIARYTDSNLPLCERCFTGGAHVNGFDVVASIHKKPWYVNGVKLQVEVKPFNEAFDGRVTVESTFEQVPSFYLNIPNIPQGYVKWRARYVYEKTQKDRLNVSPWLYGNFLKASQKYVLLRDTTDTTLLVREGTSVEIPKAMDGSLTPHSILSATHGEIRKDSNNRLYYTHDGSESTTDESIFVVSDGIASSVPVYLHVDVEPVNDPPVAVSDTTSVDEGQQVWVSVLANDTDAERNVLLLQSIKTPPIKGTASIQNGQVVYLHDGTETSSDSLVYVVSDGLGGTSEGTVIFSVRRVNDAPLSADDTSTVLEGALAQVDVLLNDSDAESNPLTVFSIETQPLHGSATLCGMKICYEHDASESTSDSFTYKVSDGQGGVSGAGRVTITVTPVNDPPQSFEDRVHVQEGGVARIEVLKNDMDVDSTQLKVEVATGELLLPAYGQVEVQNGVVVYVHGGGENILDVFEYRVSDEFNSASVSRVFVEVDPVNDAPVLKGSTDFSGAVAYKPYTLYYEQVAAHLEQKDAENDGILYLIENISNGTFEYSGGEVVFGVTLFRPGESITWTPVLNKTEAIDMLTVRACDGHAYSEKSVTVKVFTTQTDGLPPSSGNTGSPARKKSGCAEFDASNGWLVCAVFVTVVLRRLRVQKRVL